MATLASYTTLCQQEVDDTSTSAKSVIEQRLKETYQDILLTMRKYLVSSVTTDRTATPNTAVYTPSEFEELTLHYKETDSDWVQLKPISEREYLDKYINAEAGTPHSFFLNDGNYQLVPAPINAGTIKETIMPITPALSTSSIIPDRYTNVMILGATYRFKAYEDNPSTNVYKNWYEQAKHNMELDLATRTKIIQPKLYR